MIRNRTETLKTKYCSFCHEDIDVGIRSDGNSGKEGRGAERVTWKRTSVGISEMEKENMSSENYFFPYF